MWFAHALLGALWLLSGIIAAAAVVELFRSPKHAIEIFGAFGTMIGVVKVTAQAKGIPAWPMFDADPDFPNEIEAPVDGRDGNERLPQ